MAKLRNSEVNSYAYYSFSSGFANVLPLSYISVFLTEYIGYSAALMGSILLLARIVDFSIGLVSGSIVQKANFKWGKYRSWLVILRYVLFIGITLQFLNTNALPLAARVVITFIGYGMLHFSMNFIQTAQIGTLSYMAGGDMEDRTRLSVRASQFMVVASILTSAITIPIIKFITPYVGNASAYSITAIVFAAIGVSGNLVLSKVAAPYDLPASKDTVSNTRTIKVKDLVNSIFTNNQLLVYILAAATNAVSGSTMSGIQAYYFMYVLGNFSLMAVSLTITNIFAFFASIIGPRIGRKLGKKNAMVCGLFVSAISCIMIAIFAKSSVVIFIVFNCINFMGRYLYMGFGANYVLDTGEYGFYKTGKDYRATATGLYTIPAKTGFALGGAIAGFGLAVIGYKSGMTVTPAFTNNLMWILGGIPAVLYALAGIIMLVGYRITDADAAKYAAANAERLQKASGQTA